MNYRNVIVTATGDSYAVRHQHTGAPALSASKHELRLTHEQVFTDKVALTSSNVYIKKSSGHSKKCSM